MATVTAVQLSADEITKIKDFIDSKPFLISLNVATANPTGVERDTFIKEMTKDKTMEQDRAVAAFDALDQDKSSKVTPKEVDAFIIKQ